MMQEIKLQQQMLAEKQALMLEQERAAKEMEEAERKAAKMAKLQ